MDGSFNNGYLPYGQQHPTQQQQQQHQSAHASPSSVSAPPSHHHHQQQQNSVLNSYGHHQTDSPTNHPTLPPLQGQNGYSPYPALPYGHAGSQSHTPPGSHTPVSASIGNGHGYAHQAPSMMPHSYNQPYGIPQPMMYPSSSATSVPQSSATSGLPNIRPMPPGGASMAGLPSMSNNGHLGQQAAFLQNEEAPLHVVGQQGRRGVLPSAPGRPGPPAPGSGIANKSMIPQKDADGKFPCPHCNKTYLHAKHLKRHLLRHTGDRPYMCHLCKDTFSRSDILKRHFQKCSIRRGNPTGANHLAHQRRSTNSSNRLSMTQQESPMGLTGITDAAGGPYNPANVLNNSPSLNSELSARSSRANSLIGPNGMGQRGGITGLGIMSSSGPNGEALGATAGYQPSMSSYAMSTPPGNFAYSNPPMNGSGYSTPTQQVSFLGQTSSRFNSHPSNHSNAAHMAGDDTGSQIDWSRMFSAGGQDGFVGSQTANASSDLNDVKPDTVASRPQSNGQNSLHDLPNESFLGSLYSHHEAFSSEYSIEEGALLFALERASTQGLLPKLEQLIQFCLPLDDMSDSGDRTADLLKMCLDLDNFRHFITRYAQFNACWPVLHVPTLDLLTSHNILLLAMLGAGIVYSTRLSSDQSQALLVALRKTMFARSEVYACISRPTTDSLQGNLAEVEQLQGILIIQVISIWHGDAQQRDEARKEFPGLVKAARAAGLYYPSALGQSAYRAHHAMSSATVRSADEVSFHWQPWIEQEKRNRLMYSLLLLDTAMSMFFNCLPQIDPLDLRILLPADESAWRASSQKACAHALEQDAMLHGMLSPSSGCSSYKLTMHDALRTLLDQNASLPEGSTNTYSKFLLINALITRIAACQRLYLGVDLQGSSCMSNLSGSGPATPMSQGDWLDPQIVGGSGQATPTDGIDMRPPVQLQCDKKRLGLALDKWKQAWDIDVEVRYQTENPRPQSGFRRHAPDLFFLSRSFLQTRSPIEWRNPPDVRFVQVLSLLKRIAGFKAHGNTSRGFAATEISNDGIAGTPSALSLDMKTLFSSLAS